MGTPVIEYVITDTDSVRGMIKWLAKRSRITVTSLVRHSGARSQSLVNFSNPNPETQRTKDTSINLIIALVISIHYLIFARPVGGKHLQVRHGDAMPLEVRAPGGELLEIPLEKMESLITLGATIALATGESLSALADKAQVSYTFASYVKGTSTANDMRVRPLLAVLREAGFELVVQPLYVNARQARLAEKSGN